MNKKTPQYAPDTYTVVRANGQKEYIESEKPLSLKKLQSIVGGPIEFATRKVGEIRVTFCINEEGLLLKLPENKLFPEFVGNVVLGQYRETKDGNDYVGGIFI